MGRNFNLTILAVLILTICISTSLFAASKKQDTKVAQTNKQKIESYSGGNDEHQVGTSSIASKSSLTPRSASSSISPGLAIGNTWYDAQHNGTIGRMIDWGNDPDGNENAVVHFGWMQLSEARLESRHYAYNHYHSALGVLGTVTSAQPSDEYAGYVNLHATGDARAVIGGHSKSSAGYQSQIYYDFTPGLGFWTANSRVDDSVASYAATPVQSVIWPKFAYQETTDTVTHILAQVSAPSAADPQAIYYFRKVGSNDQGSWDYPPYVVDTIYDLSHDITASLTSDKVAISWTANLNYDGGPNNSQYAPGVCDTCSGKSNIAVQWDNDIYYQTSDDQGATWNPRVNVTKSRLGEAGYRAYTDLSVLIDSQEDVHIIWSAIPWAAEIANITTTDACRLFHYSEDIPFVRTITSAEWPTTKLDGSRTFDCGPPAWNIYISKMSISECDGKFYALWSQFNDLPNGITDDCAARAHSEYGGSANGELYLSVSADGGSTWDLPRNLTNSRTPGCDPATGGADCESDMWASMAEYGRQNKAGEDWAAATIVDPSGSYASDYYLDVQYIHDRDAGSTIKNEGSWQLSNVNWFRLACVEPFATPGPVIVTPNRISLPTWVKPGEGLDLDLTLENSGNVAFDYTITIDEENGPAGWLNVSGLNGSVPSGLAGIEVGTLHLNQGGIETSEAGLLGSVIFTSNSPTSPDTIHVSLIVADTVVPTSKDTVIGWLSLSVSTNGNYGNQGDGRVNMDFVTNGVDCDTLADVYLYDGSPIILTENGIDTTGSWSIFGEGWLHPNGFKPQGGQESGSETDFNWYKTGTFTTPDTTIAFSQSFYAPTATNANFIIKILKIWSADGASHNGLRIGDAIDWDIPSDTGAWNEAGIDPTPSRNLIYQSGAEYHQDDTGVNAACIDSDNRFGGMAFLKSVLNDTDKETNAYSAYTARNDSFVFPKGNFDAGQLWNNMDAVGFSVETDVADQHMVMCYEPSLSLAPGDTIEFWTVLATVTGGTAADLADAVDAAEAFAINNRIGDPCPLDCCHTACCCGIRGDYDLSGGIDISDLVALVSFMFSGGDPSDCFEKADVDGSGGIDISDLVGLVSFMFSGGKPPADCPY